MPMFTYEAMNSVGQAIKGQIDATSKEDAIAKIRAKGEYPTKVKARAAKKSTFALGQKSEENASGRRRSAGRVANKLLVQFTRQFATLNDAGLPVVRSLRILEEQQKPGHLRNAIRMVAEDVEEGKPLSEAMAVHGKVFDRLYCNMVHIGETGGLLDQVLQQLADFLEKSRALRARVISAMIYPIAVISFSVLIVMGIMWKVIPQFKIIFADFGQDLPAVTTMLIDASEWVAGGGWIVIFMVPVGLIFLIKLIRMSQQGRYALDLMTMNIPVFGDILQKTSVARFTRTLGTLLGAGVPILEAINITHAAANNEVFSRAMKTVHDSIREGESFATPLRQAKIVDPMVVNMIDVGEETGKQDQMLEKIADVYDEEVKNAVDGMVSLLEPIMVIMLGGIVGFIVIALFLPMISMIQNLSGS
jgi:type IV pilus assembly protein PilC